MELPGQRRPGPVRRSGVVFGFQILNLGSAGVLRGWLKPKHVQSGPTFFGNDNTDSWWKSGKQEVTVAVVHPSSCSKPSMLTSSARYWIWRLCRQWSTIAEACFGPDHDG